MIPFWQTKTGKVKEASTWKRPGAEFKKDKAARAVDFIETACRHVKGELAGQLFKIEGWQREIVRGVFGWHRLNGTRLYREVYIEIPRKNGKSSMGAALALYLLFADGEQGAEIYCLDPSTRILYDDLIWREIGQAKEGDKIVGVDENTPKPGFFRKLQHSQISHVRHLVAERFRLDFDNGASVICSENHKWLVAHTGKDRNSGWSPTKNLSVGREIRYLCAPWTSQRSHMAGYLAGMFDGEGYFHAPRAERSAFRMGVTQKPGAVFDATVSALREMDFDPKLFLQSKGTVMNAEISGLTEVIRLIGSVRPIRFVNRNSEIWEGKSPNRTGYAKINAITPLGQGPLVDIETTSKTFFAEGLFSHNSAAADTDQAAIVFGVAKGMVEQDPDLESVSESFRRSIVYKSNAYHVLSADAPTKHGKNSSGILFDELHAQPNRELYDVLKTSTGSRRQPLLWMFTTAGFDRHSICWEVHEYAQKVIDGTVNDPAFLPIIYAADDGDDWTSEKTWKKANPNYNVSIKADYLRAECEKAKVTPAYENTFKRLHLNIWTQQDVRWLQMSEWDACAGEPINYDALKGRRCFGGLDLATTTDIAALALIFPGEPFIVLPFFWIPEEHLQKRVQRDRVPYDVWQRQGYIEATPGNLIDYRYIMLRLGQCRIDFDFKALAFDRWGSTQIITTLCDEFGFTSDEKEAANYRKSMLWKFGQGWSSMNAPTKELLNYILARKITHGGNPVLRWMANNVVVKEDPAGNLKPDKGRSLERIDGVIAMIMGLELALRAGNGPASRYETEGLFVI